MTFNFRAERHEFRKFGGAAGAQDRYGFFGRELGDQHLINQDVRLRSALPAVFQTFTRPSEPPEATLLPSALSARAWIESR